MPLNTLFFVFGEDNMNHGVQLCFKKYKSTVGNLFLIKPETIETEQKTSRQ